MIHVAYCSDSLMLPGLHAAVASMLSHQRLPVTIWMFLRDCPPSDVRAIADTAEGRADLRFLDIDLEPFSAFRGLMGSIMPYARLALPDHVECERLIYLDSDTLCLADLESLWSAPLEDKALGMVQYGCLGNRPESGAYLKTGLDPAMPHYNSGVIIFDIARWRSDGCFEKCLQFGQSHRNELFTADQVCINGALSSLIAKLDAKWNRPVFPGTPSLGLSSAGFVLHFVGSPKPWDLFARLAHRNVALHRFWLKRSEVRARPRPKEAWVPAFRRLLRIRKSYQRNFRTPFGRIGCKRRETSSNG